MYADLLSWIYERSPFEKYFWFSRIYLCFNNFKNMIVLKYQESTTEKLFENACTNLFFGGWGQTLSKTIGVWWVQIWAFFEVPESQINMFPRCSHKLSNIRWGIFGIRKAINTGSTGPEMTNNRSKKSQDFESCRNNPKSIGIWPGTSIRHLGKI